MYSVTVSDHIMIAHSLRGAVFGPAQGVHGATFVVSVTFKRPALDADGIVVDIGAATTELKAMLAEIDYKNLDDLEIFRGVNTTTEFLANWVWRRMRDRIAEGALGEGAKAVTALAVTLGETPSASAGFEAALDL